MITALLLTCLFLALLHYYINYFGRKGRLINRIPGYISLPIIGNILHVCWRSQEGLWLFIYEKAMKNHSITRFWFFTMPNVLTYDPNHIEKILNSSKNIVKGYVYKFIHPWLGDGLLTSTGMKWQKRRKLLTPAFHFSILKQFAEVFVEEGNSAVKLFNHEEETIIEDMQLFTSYHTLNAICETSMGISLKGIGRFEQEYRQSIFNMGKILITRVFKPWLISDTLFKLTSLSNMQDKYLNILHSFTEKIIAERKVYHEQTGRRYLKYFENNTETEEVTVKKKRMALLDILIAESHNSGLTDVDIREEVDTFMFEGHDTVAIALCFSLLLLAEHKDIQDRVRKEISEVMQENDGKLTINALQNLSYLERCLKESIRMYPSVPIISRDLCEDVQLNPYVVPEGTTVHLYIYKLHYDRNFWPNPEIFDPDRFLPEKMSKRHPYCYVPFSAGPRNCIGQRYAMLELKALVAPMVYNFHLEPVDYLKDVKLKFDFVLRATRPIRMKVIPIRRT